jgi:hypothetical protein
MEDRGPRPARRLREDCRRDATGGTTSAALSWVAARTRKKCANGSRLRPASWDLSALPWKAANQTRVERPSATWRSAAAAKAAPEAGRIQASCGRRYHAKQNQISFKSGPARVHARLRLQRAPATLESTTRKAGRIIGMQTFGASAPLEELQKKFGFEPEQVAAAARELLGR